MKAFTRKFIQELFMNEMHLTKVRLARVLGDARTVFDGRAGVGVALHPKSFNQANGVNDRLSEPMDVASTNGDDPWHV